jgi:hypothetical protein
LQNSNGASTALRWRCGVQGKNGEVYLPIFERLESEIATARAKEATLERARQRCEAQAGRPVRPAGNLQAIRGLESEDEDQRVTGSTNPDDAKQPKNDVPLKDRLSLSPLDASALTGIGLRAVDLNREALVRLRAIRDRMTKCLPLVAEGVMALRDFPTDTLPSYLRGRAMTSINQTTDMAVSIQKETDAVLLAFAKSDFIDPDEGAADRSAAREEYMKDLHALYPGKPFRAARKKRGS